MPYRYHRPRTVIITGASAGVGRAIAQRFARAGDRIGLIARDDSALQDVQRGLQAVGAEAAWEAADVANAKAIFAAAERLEQRLGKVDIWINDAMETVFSTVADMDPDEFRRVTEVCYLGFVHGTMAALNSMRPRRRGRIIQIGSALAYRGIPLQAAYCGAKHAIRGFNDALRSELLHEHSDIVISMIHLPAVNTPQFDWARVHIGHTPPPDGTANPAGGRRRCGLPRGSRPRARILARMANRNNDPGKHHSSRVARPLSRKEGHCWAANGGTRCAGTKG
jgi:NAD(P)-dependent dehydrogenase (short-subunit alcohol dehydrogenase family)